MVKSKEETKVVIGMNGLVYEFIIRNNNEYENSHF